MVALAGRGEVHVWPLRDIMERETHEGAEEETTSVYKSSSKASVSLDINHQLVELGQGRVGM